MHVQQGVRVSELVALNRQGIDFDNMRVVAYGKGAKGAGNLSYCIGMNVFKRVAGFPHG